MKKYWYTFIAYCLTAPVMAQEEFGELPPPPRDQSPWHTFMLIGIALLFFYFILWRPEQKKRKELEEARSTLNKGSRVVAMGIIGTVSRIEEKTVILKMVDGTKIEFLKAAISEIIQDETPE